MKPAEIFGVVVRTIGLLMTMIALAQTLFALLVTVLGGPANGPGLLIFSLPALVVGIWLLRGAKAVVWFAYPDES